MTAERATVIDFPARSEGRPSNAALQMENRTLRAALADITDDRDELDAELHAYVTERLAVAAEMVALARRGQIALAAGRSPAAQIRRAA